MDKVTILKKEIAEETREILKDLNQFNFADSDDDKVRNSMILLIEKASDIFALESELKDLLTDTKERG